MQPVWRNVYSNRPPICVSEDNVRCEILKPIVTFVRQGGGCPMTYKTTDLSASDILQSHNCSSYAVKPIFGRHRLTQNAHRRGILTAGPNAYYTFWAQAIHAYNVRSMTLCGILVRNLHLELNWFSWFSILHTGLRSFGTRRNFRDKW